MPASTFFCRIAFIAGLAAMGAGASPAARTGALELELPAVREAALRGNLKAVEAARSRFAGHVLEPYPAYWLLMANLVRADRGEVAAFLARHPDTPLAAALRRDWLKVLGGRGDWEAFRAEYLLVQAEDVEISCYALQERMARQDPEARAEARALFVSGREATAACEPVFATLAAEGAVTEAEILARTRRLLHSQALRDAKRAAALLPARNRISDKLIDQVAADPSRHLAREAKSSLLTRNDRELVAFALARLARSKPEEAAERLVQAAPRLGESLTQLAWAHVAHHAAIAHHPRALEWFALAGNEALTDAQVAWKARAAMRAGAWKETLAAIQQFSAEEARAPAWRYWRARALIELGEAEAGKGLLRSLAGDRSFYGILAAEELGAATPPEWAGWKPQAADIERARSIPGVRRALALYRADLDAEAFREWAWAIRDLGDHDLLAAAEAARLAGEPDRAINTANRTAQLHDLGQRFPITHHEAVAAAARQWGMDEALMFAIIRQESRFMPQAKSRVGATGLMQLMPATANWVARQIPVQPYRAEMLLTPEVNVRMGTFYFGRVLGDLGHPVLATAAYNAGPGRARRWRDARALDGAVYVETIPFDETRDYVKQVFANAWFYRHRLTGQLPSLREMVGTIPGRDGTAAPALAAGGTTK